MKTVTISLKRLEDHLQDTALAHKELSQIWGQPVSDSWSLHAIRESGLPFEEQVRLDMMLYDGLEAQFRASGFNRAGPEWYGISAIDPAAPPHTIEYHKFDNPTSDLILCLDSCGLTRQSVVIKFNGAITAWSMGTIKRYIGMFSKSNDVQVQYDPTSITDVMLENLRRVESQLSMGNCNLDSVECTLYGVKEIATTFGVQIPESYGAVSGRYYRRAVIERLEYAEKCLRAGDRIDGPFLTNIQRAVGLAEAENWPRVKALYDRINALAPASTLQRPPEYAPPSTTHPRTLKKLKP